MFDFKIERVTISLTSDSEVNEVITISKYRGLRILKFRMLSPIFLSISYTFTSLCVILYFLFKNVHDQESVKLLVMLLNYLFYSNIETRKYISF